MAARIKEFCLGHINSLKRECVNCPINNYNHFCDLYRPIFLEDYILSEKPKIIPYEHLGVSCEDNEEFYERFKLIGREDDNEGMVK